MSSSVIFQAQSFIIVGILLYGVYHRKNRYKHIRMMYLGIIWDLLLVAQIELSRQAIATASMATTNPVLLNIHISLAVSTVLLYGVMVITGKKLQKHNESFRTRHKILGWTTLTVRILTLITSYLIETNLRN